MLAESKTSNLEELRFLTAAHVQALVAQHGSPLFTYSEEALIAKAKESLAFQAPYGLTVRFAMKANPLSAILKLFNERGLHIDASSGYEVERAIDAGIPANHIMLTSQQIPKNLKDLVGKGVKFNATSLHQLRSYGQLSLKSPLAIRVNAGIGSGYRRGVSVAGPGASFGIWHQYMDQVRDLIREYDLCVDTIHSHIGCGSDPAVWHQVAELTLNLVDQFPAVTTLNLGGGFKVARMAEETATELDALSLSVAKLIRDYYRRTSRKLKLEIEPGTFLTANAGALIATVQDMSDTGPDGYNFLKLDTGMNDIMRPALHASQHPIVIINDRPLRPKQYVVVGHNCESSDLLTPSPEDSELPQPRDLQEAAIGDLAVIEGVGAYCSSMRLIGYNSFPTPKEIMLGSNGQSTLIRARQGVKDLIAAEIS